MIAASCKPGLALRHAMTVWPMLTLCGARRELGYLALGALSALHLLTFDHPTERSLAAEAKPAETAHIALHVSPAGSDSNQGSREKPLRTLGRAIELSGRAGAATATEIRVARGTYSFSDGLGGSGAGLTLNRRDGLRLSGGWESDFSKRSGRTVLDDKKRLSTILDLLESEGIVLSGFSFRNAQNVRSGGSALKLLFVKDSRIEDCDFQDNTGAKGAAIHMDRSTDNEISIEARRNFGYSGGVVYLDSSHDNRLRVVIEDSNGTGLELDSSNGNRIRGRLARNRGGTGGGLRLSWSNRNEFDLHFLENTAAEGGGAWAEIGNNNSFRGLFERNKATAPQAVGGGLYYAGFLLGDKKGRRVEDLRIDAEFRGNEAARGAGAYIAEVYDSKLTIRASGNRATELAGGLYLNRSSGNHLLLHVTNNSAAAVGGAYVTGANNFVAPESRVWENIATDSSMEKDLRVKETKGDVLAVIRRLNTHAEAYRITISENHISDECGDRFLEFEKSFQPILRRYRPHWFAAWGLKRIWLTYGLRGHGRAVEAQGTYESVWMQPPQGVGAFAHELGHAMNLTRLPLRKWQTLNPRGWKYVGYNAHGSVPRPGFVSGYATAHHLEDIAEMFSMLMHSYPALKETARKDPIVAAKMRYLLAEIKKLTPDFTEDYLAQLHARR